MKATRYLRSSALTLAIAAVVAAPLMAHSQSATAVESLKTTLASLDGQTQKLVRELEFTEYKRNSTASKLEQTRLDAQQKEADLQSLRVSLGEAPSAAQLEIITNEEQRLALAAINIKSLTASVERLERKEADLRDQLAALESKKQDATKSIARTHDSARARAIARARAVEAELAALKEENERLRLAMEAETHRAEAARAQRLTQQQEQLNPDATPTRVDGTAAVTRREVSAAESSAGQVDFAAEQASAEPQPAAAVGEAFSSRRYAIDSGNEPNPPAPEPVQIADVAPVAEDAVEEEEPPVYMGDDGPKVIIRSRSIDKPVVMQPIDGNLFEAEVKVEAGRAYFDVRNKRFRGHFPESDKSQTFVFRYDARGEEPSFTVKAKTAINEAQSAEDPQMISDSGSPF